MVGVPPSRPIPARGKGAIVMIAREWKRIKLDGCEEEFTIKVGFPVDEKGNYAGKDKYGFIAFLRFSDGSNIAFHEKKGIFAGTRPLSLFAVNSLPSRFNEKLAAARFIEAGGFPWAVCLAGKELKQVNPSFGDHL